MKLDGFGIFVKDMKLMVEFYKNVLGFNIDWVEGQSNVYLEKDGTLFLMYGRNDFEKMTSKTYEYVKGLNGHYEIALSVPTYKDVDIEYKRVITNGAVSVLEPDGRGDKELVI